MAHTAQVPADFVSTFRRRFAPLFGRKIGRQRSEQYLGGLLSGRAERRNVTSLAGTVDGATARALGWLLNKSPWQTRPVVDALQAYVGDTFGTTDGLFTLNLDSFVKRGDNAVGVEKQYVDHLGRTQNCQIGVFLAYGSEQNSALVDAALYLPHGWIDDPARRARAGVPESVEYQSKSALVVELLRRTRATGCLPGAWVTTWHGEGFESDLRARLDAEGWLYLLPVQPTFSYFGSPDSADAMSVVDLLHDVDGEALVARQVWEPAADPSLVWEGPARRSSWLLACTDQLTGRPVAFVANAPHGDGAGDAVKTLERMLAARWETARMLAARCAGVSLDVYRVRGWDGWHRHVALALLASAFRACLPALPSVPAPAAEAAPSALPPAAPEELPAFAKPVVLHPADALSSDDYAAYAAASPDAYPVAYDNAFADESMAGLAEANAASAKSPLAQTVASIAAEEPAMEPSSERSYEPAPRSPGAAVSIYHLAVDLAESDWRAVRAYQVWLVADEAGSVLESAPSRAEIERQDVGPRMEVRFESSRGLEQILAALDEVPEIAVAELSADAADSAPAVAAAPGAEAAEDAEDDAEDMPAALRAELPARASAREAELMPVFDGPAEVVGNAVTEASRTMETLESSRELVVAQSANGNGHNGQNGQANGHVNGYGGNGSGAVTLDSLAVPTAPASALRAEPPASKAKEQEKARPAEEQVVVLDLGEESYGIPVQWVREIIRVPPITRVPNGPAFLEGVINLRGQVIPVMDLRKHLGIPSGDETRRSRVVVAELGRHTVGLIVDGVSQVVMVAASDIEPPPSLIAGANDGPVCGVAHLGDKLVLLLDPGRVLPNR